ncbi:OmpA family protein [Dyella japonica]|uniref:Outer membrane protein OmpA-like peptidoglycan-associated protein n=1 Tax=Dyella japonica TaxID=231455 RepID=A0ABV2K3X5_9GAMM
MRINFTLVKVAPLLLASVFALSACGNVSRNVHKDGQAADSLVWPKISDITPMHKGGTFPDTNSLARLRAGMSKQQISDLIGFPHFSEGVWGVREWNYVFNFRVPAGSNKVVTCQFKVFFDDNKVAQSFYWAPESCAQFQQVAQVAPVSSSVISAAATMPAERYSFSADALFAFDHSSVADILGNGRAELDQFAAKVRQYDRDIKHIQVVGYTDRLGSDGYNQALSEKRANSVRDYLIAHGIDASLFSTEGRGRADPVKDCVGGTSKPSLITCLAPNRRVEILISTQRTTSDR